MSILNVKIVQDYIRMCNDGWLQGWHERNGGNLTYRMKADEVEACKPFFKEPGPWVNMGVTGLKRIISLSLRLKTESLKADSDKKLLPSMDQTKCW